MRQILLSAPGATKCGRLLLQSASGFTSVTDYYDKVRQVLQSATVITKWDVTSAIWMLMDGWVNLCDVKKLNSKY